MVPVAAAEAAERNTPVPRLLLPWLSQVRLAAPSSATFQGQGCDIQHAGVAVKPSCALVSMLSGVQQPEKGCGRQLKAAVP